MRDLVRLAAASIPGPALLTACAAFRIWRQGQADERRPADAIVVLGAATHGGRPSAVFAARLDHAIDLHRAGLAPVLMVTGGRRAGDGGAEADVARTYALARGVPDAAILAEDCSTDTLSSLRGVARLLREHSLGSAVLVSDRLHMLRALRIAADEGIRAYGSPTTTSPIDQLPAARARSMLHELVALARYLLTQR